MCLTIHYKLRWTPPKLPPNEGSVLRFVEEARRRIVRARLGHVTELRFADGGAFNGRALAKVKYDPRDGSKPFDTYLEVTPDSGYLFTLDVGADCEPTTMGLCRYPERVRQLGRVWGVKLPGWRLDLFSKTQYASLHGWEHFRRCHLAVIAALEIWRGLGARVKISDEGGYWPRRSERTLRRELDQMNGAIAGLAGVLKDAADEDGGPPVQAPILAHPQFERLEANGVRKHGSKIAAVAAALARPASSA
ncbi:MAG: hypothetical protein HY736_13305 [Verrucomicrobia bacterium]|nr:hypothetical protein [Verrucomicrobiota bacterium]